MDEVDFVLWLVAAAITIGLVIIAAWQIWIHHQLDERIADCDPALLSSVSHRVETSTDAPAGSVVVPYVPVQMVQVAAIQQPTTQQQLSEKNVE
ncbi:MAG TPA: hypothetical protein HA340_03130 [Candidatus Thalassarchaeaceae archaeon]|nr:MAG TPA: hypothetical protein D7H97_03085 [Candidatus Poseidoniales archaeon]HIH82919.1 hypothetical protein [Candidatus Thalassarchaeaceae archaeon]